mmetsp:Transcript_19613/g.47469  ORF Transcript_19613/g.47469 Transcript_19613/m.47469 type:complete len:204 (-) Transcript_19613:706-1317(-)
MAMAHRPGMQSPSVSRWLTGILVFGSHPGATAGLPPSQVETQPHWRPGCTIWSWKNFRGQHQQLCQHPMVQKATPPGRTLRQRDQIGPDRARRTGRNQFRTAIDRVPWVMPMTACWRSCGRYESKMRGCENAWREPGSLRPRANCGTRQRHPVLRGIWMATAQLFRILDCLEALHRIRALCGMSSRGLSAHDTQRLHRLWLLP